jgi:hypothetical protein
MATAVRHHARWNQLSLGEHVSFDSSVGFVRDAEVVALSNDWLSISLSGGSDELPAVTYRRSDIHLSTPRVITHE